MKGCAVGKKGFTIIEIMIVVAIIGLLAGVATPTFLNAQSRARTNVCISHLRHIDEAKSMWAVWEGATGEDTPEWAELVPDYLNEMPTCPAGGTYTMMPVDIAPECTIEGHVLG